MKRYFLSPALSETEFTLTAFVTCGRLDLLPCDLLPWSATFPSFQWGLGRRLTFILSNRPYKSIAWNSMVLVIFSNVYNFSDYRIRDTIYSENTTTPTTEIDF